MILVLTFFAHIVLALCLDENKPTTVVLIVVGAAAAFAAATAAAIISVAAIGDRDVTEAVVDRQTSAVVNLDGPRTYGGDASLRFDKKMQRSSRHPQHSPFRSPNTHLS